MKQTPRDPDVFVGDAEVDDFDVQLRQLAARSPQLDPAQLPRVLAPRLRSASPTPMWRVAAVLVTLGGALASWWSWPRPDQVPVADFGGTSAPLVVIIPLEDGTPLYLSLAHP